MPGSGHPTTRKSTRMLPEGSIDPARPIAAAAVAGGAVRTGRPRLYAVVAVTALLGIGLTVGVAAVPAIAEEHGDAIAALTVVDAPSHSTAGAVATAVPTATLEQAATETLAEVEHVIERAEVVTSDVAAAGLGLGEGPTWIDTMALRSDADALRDLDGIAPILRGVRVHDAGVRADEVMDAAIGLRERLTAAEKRKAAQEAAARARAAANTVPGAKATAREMASSRYGWGSGQFSCLVSLWNRESGWDYRAYNGSSGATGIPQALPGSKMASAGGDWRTNATTQISWGLGYIHGVYGSPCSAWSHSQATGWY